MKPLWTQIPLSKITKKSVAETFVMRGWVAKIEDIHIELTDEQKKYRVKLDKQLEANPYRRTFLWTKVPLSPKIENISLYN